MGVYVGEGVGERDGAYIRGGKFSEHLFCRPGSTWA